MPRTGLGALIGDGLFVKVVLAGLVPLVAASGLVLWQSRNNVGRQDRANVTRVATRAAGSLSTTFEQWRSQILIASNNDALQRWYRFPKERAALRPTIDRLQIQLNSLYPDLIDEGCVIDLSGAEQARQVHGVPAPIADLSPDESGSPFFAPTFALPLGRVFQAQPYVSADSKRWVISNSTPIGIDGTKRAFLHFEASLEGVRQRLIKEMPAGGSARVVDADTGLVLLDTTSAAVVDAPFVKAGSRPDGISGQATVDGGDDNRNHWVVEVTVPASAAVLSQDLLQLALMVLVALVGLVIVAWRFRMRLVTPIENVVVVADRMAEGDLTQRIDLQGREDAISKMGGAVNRAVERLDGALEQIGQEAGSLDRVAGELSLIADSMSDRAASTSILVGSLSDAVSGAASRVASVSGSAEGLTQAIDEIAQRSAGVTTTARDAVAMARETSTSVTRLAAVSSEIGGVIAAIRTIAHTTNQLALNATIEAARAGEAGRGFAVVANEVKNLSQETTRATNEIESRIQAVQMETAMVDEAMRAIADVVGHIEDDQTSIAAAVEQQLAATNEIARAANGAATEVATIGRAVLAVGESADENVSGAARNRQMADTVAERSRVLAGLATSFTHR